MVVSFMIPLPSSSIGPSWVGAAAHPCYEQLFPDPTAPRQFLYALSRTFRHALEDALTTLWRLGGSVGKRCLGQLLETLTVRTIETTSRTVGRRWRMSA